jgi:hypothetical protein
MLRICHYLFCRQHPTRVSMYPLIRVSQLTIHPQILSMYIPVNHPTYRLGHSPNNPSRSTLSIPSFSHPPSLGLAPRGSVPGEVKRASSASMSRGGGQFKTDTHTHTKDGDKCPRLRSPKERGVERKRLSSATTPYPQNSPPHHPPPPSAA